MVISTGFAFKITFPKASFVKITIYSFFHPPSSDMILTIHVKPNAKKESLEWLDEDTIIMSVSAAPEKGKANKKVVELLAEELGVAKSRISLIRGATARIKQVEIK